MPLWRRRRRSRSSQLPPPPDPAGPCPYCAGSGTVNVATTDLRTGVTTIRRRQPCPACSAAAGG
jgi:hypothetical protein